MSNSRPIRTAKALRAERLAALNLMEDAIDSRERLHTSEKRYRALFAASPAPFLVVKPDAPRFTIAEVNHAYLTATMRTRETVIGRGLFEAFPDNPDDATIAGVSTLRASLERVLASRQPHVMSVLKYDIARPDGTFEERWWSPVNSPVLDENGKVDAIIHNSNDVTKEHRAEVALRASEEQFRRAIEEAPIPVIMHAEDGQVLQISRTWTELTGYTPEDMPTFDAWLNLAYGPGAEKVRDHLRQLFRGCG